MLKIKKYWLLAPEKSLSRGFYSFSKLSSCFVLGLPARAALFWKRREQRKEPTHA